MTVYIILTIAGANVGPFDLYSDLDGYVAPFETGITRDQLVTGYVSILVPDGTTSIKVQSTGVCTNYIILYLPNYTTTTSTSSTSTTTTLFPPTTTTTTTGFGYYELVDCDTGNHYTLAKTCYFEVGGDPIVARYQIGVPGSDLIRCGTIIGDIGGPPNATFYSCVPSFCGDTDHCNKEP